MGLCNNGEWFPFFLLKPLNWFLCFIVVLCLSIIKRVRKPDKNIIMILTEEFSDLGGNIRIFFPTQKFIIHDITKISKCWKQNLEIICERNSEKIKITVFLSNL